MTTDIVIGVVSMLGIVAAWDAWRRTVEVRLAALRDAASEAAAKAEASRLAGELAALSRRVDAMTAHERARAFEMGAGN